MRMKRLLIAFCLLVVPGMAHAFESDSAALRIGILRTPDSPRLAHAEDLHNTIREALRAELRSRGVDAYLAVVTFDDLSKDDGDTADADYFVELAGDAWLDDRGGIGVGGRHADMSIGVVDSKVAADVFVYDGRTLEMIVRESLSKRNRSVMPTGVGVGSRSLFGWIALPFVERAQVRRVARSLADDIADVVLGAVRER